MRHLIALVLTVLSLHLAAADPAWDRIPTTVEGQVASLVKAEAVLAKAPRDQAALGDAIAALLTLTLDTQIGSEGTWPLRHRARLYADRRAAARGKPAASLAGSWQELWCLALTGDSARAMAEIARLDPKGTHPLAVALTIAATRDHRAHAETPEPGGFLELALKHAFLVTDCRGNDRDSRKVSRKVHRTERILVDALAVCAHPALAPSAAKLRTDLAKVFAVAPAALDKTLAAWRGEMLPAGALTALLRWCRSVSDPPDAKDEATRASEWIAWLTEVCMSEFAIPLFYHEERLAMAAAGDLVPQTLQIGYMMEGNDVESLPELAARLLDSNQPPLDPTTRTLLVYHLIRLSGPGLPPGARAWSRAVERWRAEPEASRDPLAIDLLSRSGAWLGQLLSVRKELEAAVARDPWSAQLAVALALSAETLRPPERAPTKTWQDAHLDVATTGAWPNVGWTSDFLIAWEGMLRIAEAGEYDLAIESAGATTLAIGDRVMQLGNSNGVRRRVLSSRLAAGDHPVRVLMLQRTGELACRLLWRRGDQDFVPVPANVLLDQSGAPGLAARGWQLDGADLAACCREPNAAFEPLRRLPFWPQVGRRLALASQATCWDGMMLPAYRLTVQVPGSSTARHTASDLLHLQLLRGDQLNADERLEVYRCYGVYPYCAWGGDQGLLLDLLAINNEWQELVAAVPDWKDPSRDPSMATFAMLVFLNAGRFTEALAIADMALHSDHAWGIRPMTRACLRLRSLPFMRMYGKRVPPAAALRKELQRREASPSMMNCLGFLLNELSMHEALAAAQGLKDGDEVQWYIALDHLAHGEHDAAQAMMRQVIQAHPQWGEAHYARALLRWYAQQTPATLAALPVDPTVRRVAVVPIPQPPVDPTPNQPAQPPSTVPMPPSDF